MSKLSPEAQKARRPLPPEVLAAPEEHFPLKEDGKSRAVHLRRTRIDEEQDVALRMPRGPTQNISGKLKYREQVEIQEMSDYLTGRVFPIRNDEDHANALQLIEALWDDASDNPGSQADLWVEIMSALVEHYEIRRYPLPPVRRQVVSALKFVHTELDHALEYEVGDRRAGMETAKKFVVEALKRWSEEKSWDGSAAELIKDAVTVTLDVLVADKKLVDERIQAFESSYGMSTEAMCQGMSDGTLKETDDICTWFALLNRQAHLKRRISSEE